MPAVTTRNLLELAQREGIIPDAEALWTRIANAAPTANPASILTCINWNSCEIHGKRNNVV